MLLLFLYLDNSRSYVHFLPSLLVLCFIKHTIRTVSVLNGLPRLLDPLFLPTSPGRSSEHKAEASSHHSSKDIHHPSTQIFNKTSTASVGREREEEEGKDGQAAAAILGGALRFSLMLCLIFHPTSIVIIFLREAP